MPYPPIVVSGRVGWTLKWVIKSGVGVVIFCFSIYIDVWWTHLQIKDKWLLLVPLSVSQYPLYSNIENKETNYHNVMLTLVKHRLKRHGLVASQLQHIRQFAFSIFSIWPYCAEKSKSIGPWWSFGFTRYRFSPTLYSFFTYPTFSNSPFSIFYL